MKFLLIDGSYYIFYRFYALQLWWKNAHRDEELGVPFENEIFVSAFKSAFVNKFKEIPKNLDATDGLAAALCHYYNSNPNNKIDKKYSSWSSYLKNNPEKKL